MGEDIGGGVEHKGGGESYVGSGGCITATCCYLGHTKQQVLLPGGGARSVAVAYYLWRTGKSWLLLVEEEKRRSCAGGCSRGGYWLLLLTVRDERKREEKGMAAGFCKVREGLSHLKPYPILFILFTYLFIYIFLRGPTKNSPPYAHTF